MENLQQNIIDLGELVKSQLAEFQNQLKGAIPATSPTSNITSQFGAFRSFVLTALENLQRQVELLARQQDELEMRSRRKILLVHGLVETDAEDPEVTVSKFLSERLKMPKLDSASFSRCHRLGRISDEKPRAILIKFSDYSLRASVWSAKTKLKGTGVTLSEFLIKSRHKVFLAARERFGVARCWTREGNIMVLDPSGKRHRVATMAELKNIPAATQEAPVPSKAPTGTAAAAAPEASKASQRVKRVAKK